MGLDYDQKLDSILSSLSVHVESGRCAVINTPVAIQASIPESTVRMRLAKISTTLTTLYSKLASDSNHYTPLYRLPDDLLLAIWDHLSPHDRLYIPAVSRRFRDVALASRSLWRFISIGVKDSPDKLEALLSRTSMADLHLYEHDRGKETFTGFSFGSANSNHYAPSFEQSRINMVDDALVRCTVLAASISSRPMANGLFQFPSRPTSVQLETLERMAPRLHSLRLTDTNGSSSSSSSSNATRPIPFPLFAGHTPQLLHVHFVHFSPRWDDPLYSNLTYLRLDRLMSRLSVSQMLHILKRCPNLEHLLLHSVLSDRIDGAHPLPSVALPLLRHLSVVEDSPQDIVSLVDQLHTGPCLRFGVSSTTFPAFTTRGIREGTPSAVISRADELIISGSGFEGSAFSVMSKQAGSILAHFCLSLVLSNPPPETEHTALLVDSIRHSNLPFHSIKRFRFQGGFLGTGAIRELVAMFPSLEVLETFKFSVQDGIMTSSFGQPSSVELFEIVGKEMCPNLRELRMTLVQYGRVEDLIQWLGHRNDLRYQPLRDLTVYADQPLEPANRNRMNRLVKNIQWRKRPTAFFFGNTFSFGQTAQKAVWDEHQDEDPLAEEGARAESVPKHGLPYLGDNLPDYFGVPG